MVVVTFAFKSANPAWYQHCDYGWGETRIMSVKEWELIAPWIDDGMCTHWFVPGTVD